VASFVAGAAVGASSPGREAAQRFAEAWEAGDHAAMYEELSDDAAAKYSEGEFRSAYEEADLTATVDSIETGEAAGPESGSDGDVVRVPVTVQTNAYGGVESEVALPMDDAAIAWEPHLVFPGLEPGERLERREDVPDRAPILARDGTPLAEGPPAARTSPLGAAALNVAGEIGAPKDVAARELTELGFPDGTLAGISGLEEAFNERLAGQPGGELLAVAGKRGDNGRVLAQNDPVPGEPINTTIDPVLQEAAAVALGDLFGGVAVLDTDDGSVRALAGLAYSAPQPPGSTFKIITTTAALEEEVVSLDDSFPVETSNTTIGREISNAHDSPCGGTFVETFAESCNTVFAPLGVEVGGEKLVETAEDFGFNSPPPLMSPSGLEELNPPESSIPQELDSDVAIGESAIGQGEVLATPLEMASVAQTIANGGVRSPTPLVTDADLVPATEPVEVTSEEIAGTVTDLMIEVVESGTGVAGAVPGVAVAGKTGTAELGPDTPEEGEAPPAEGEEPEQKLDAWFSAFAPAGSPEIAVGVMVVDSEGDGGEVAAPISSEIMASKLAK
jgi:cell division protein FtsI/penicillin-binding protein 2